MSRRDRAFDSMPDDRRENNRARSLPAIDCGVILGTNTKLGTLTEDERRRHEAVLARMAQKAALMRRKLPRELLDGEDDATAVA